MDRVRRTGLASQVAECAKKLARGDQSALGDLFDCAAARVVRYALAWTRSREDAEDALQAAMMRVATSPHRFAGARHPWAYFLRMVRNESLKIIGRRRSVQSFSESTGGWRLDDAIVERHELNNHVREAVKRLPPEQAEVVVLKIWENMTFLEIAQVLDESPNTAASRYRYALGKLSRALQPLADEVVYG